MQQSFEIRGRTLGLSGPCFVIGEAGRNHNGSFGQALALLDVAAEAGCDAVEFQAMELPEDWLPRLRACADEHDLALIVSLRHEEAIERLDPYVDAFEIDSLAPFLREVASRGKPVIMSTGASSLEEVREAVTILEAAGCDRLALMHAAAAYPTPPEAVNVRALVTLQETFAVPSGLCDHSEDPVVAPMAAAALGAAVLEKSYTLSKRLPGPDHAFALEPEDLRRLVAGVRAVERVVGSGVVTRDIPAEAPPSEADLEPAPEVGADRVCGPQVSEVGGLSLRPAKEGDAELVHVWANDPDTRAASFHPKSIALVDHVAWFCRELERTDHHIYIAQVACEPVGIVRLSEMPGHPGMCTISLNIAPEARGGRLGVAALEAAKVLAGSRGLQRIRALVRPENQRARKTFARAGYVEAEQTEVDGEPALLYVCELG
jgi:sialic acid synthase SpsE/RimJ/RimL family protein N-acetyltransferase